MISPSRRTAREDRTRSYEDEARDFDLRPDPSRLTKNDLINPLIKSLRGVPPGPVTETSSIAMSILTPPMTPSNMI